jgi:outer membrane protein TolC
MIFFTRFRLTVIAVLVSIISITSKAQQQVRYSLNDVIEIAQKQSPDALMAKHRFISSYWVYRNYKANYLPSLSFASTLPSISTGFKDQFVGGVTTSVFENVNRYSLDLFLEQKIGFTGGTVEVSSGLLRTDNFKSDTSWHQYTTNVINLGLTQPISMYNPDRWERRIEPLRYEEAKRIYVETNEKIAVTVIDYFFSLLLAQINVSIAKKNYSNYDTLYRIAQGRYTLGKIAENDLLQLELNLLKAESAVEDADLNYNNRLFIFKSFLRIKEETMIELIPPTETNHFGVALQTAVEQAKFNTSIGLELQRRTLEAERVVKEARSGRFDANLYAGFGLGQISNGDIRDAYTQPLDEEFVSFRISMPILDWGRTRGDIKIAESNLALVETSVEQERIDFDHNIFLNVMEFNMQEKQLLIAAKSDTVAQKRFEVTQKRYIIGKVNDVLELQNAQIDNDNARMGYYRSLMTYWKSYYEIRMLTLYDFRRNMPITISIDDLIE